MHDIKKIQKYEMDILIYIDEICRKNNIKYFLAYGTLLGAVRHEGFIPWDDDIDIIMPRPDWDKLVALLKDNQDNCRYKLCSIETEERWTAPLAKMIDSKTILRQIGHNEKMDLGLYVDIFVLDGIPSQEKHRKKLFRKLDFLQKLWGGCEYNLRKNNSIKNIVKNTVAVILSRITSARKISKRIHCTVKKFPYDLYDNVGANEYSVYKREKACTTKKILGNGVCLKFGDHLFNCPENYDEYLKNIYGDYMVLPPKEKRVIHHEYSLEFIE